MSLDREQIRRDAEALRGQGLSWRAIGRHLRLHHRRVQRICDPAIAKRDSERAKRWQLANPERSKELQRNWDRRNPEHAVWSDLIRRCTNPASKDFHNYGGRGIKVCDRWLNSFAAFLEDVGKRPSPELTFDRIDNDGDYEPGNVRWATRSEQQRNKRVKARAEAVLGLRQQGLTFREIAERCAISRQSAYRIYAEGPRQ